MTHDNDRFGTLERLEDGRPQLRFTRVLAHPIATVWRAITEPEHLEAWFPSSIEGARAPGARLRFTFPDGAADPMDGEMLAFERETTMELRWGPDIIRIELRPHAAGTELVLLDTLEDRGKGARDAAGWHVCLDALERHLAGDGTARDAMDTWPDVHPRYVASLGPDAATIGPPEGALERARGR